VVMFFELGIFQSNDDLLLDGYIYSLLFYRHRDII